MLNHHRHLFRRATLRASSIPLGPFTSQSRLIRTAAFNHSLTQPKFQLNRLQRRFASEEAAKSEDESLSKEAVSSDGVSEPIAANDTADKSSQTVLDAVSEKAQEFKDTVGDLAAKATESTSPDNSNLYVGNLWFGVREEDLRKEFERFGVVESAKLIFDGRGLSKGFGYVKMADPSAAAQAREALHGTIYEGRTINVAKAARSGNPTYQKILRPVNPPSSTLYVGNMSYEMTDRDLNDLFKQVKGVSEVRVAVDRRSGQPRGFAHADFVDQASAESAKAFLETQLFYGRKLRIDYGRNAKRDKMNQPTREIDP